MRWKTSFCLWPRRLVTKEGDGVMRFIGWVWMQRAYLTNNINHGWIAFVDNQTPEYLDVCPCCKKPVKGAA